MRTSRTWRVPKHSKHSKRCKPEAGIQKAILQLLAAEKIPAWRMNSGAYKSETGTFIRYGNKGMADIVAVLPERFGVHNAGRFLAIEVKSEKGRLTPDQKAFAETINSCCGYAIIARSVDDVIDFLGLHKASKGFKG